ncbi:MAG: hypothetical protein H6581_10245 [Bacteroidia bacterium]|nr:hypothetical protein [Bacteroidia bacterium]
MKQTLKAFIVLIFLAPYLGICQKAPREKEPLKLPEKGTALLISINTQFLVYGNQASVHTNLPILALKLHKSRQFQHRLDASVRFGAGLAQSFWDMRLNAGYEWEWFIRPNRNAVFQPYLGVGADLHLGAGSLPAFNGSERYQSLAFIPKIVPGMEINLGRRFFFDIATPLQPLALTQQFGPAGTGGGFSNNFNSFVNLRTGFGIRF